MTAIAALGRIAAAVLRAVADELDGGAQPRQRRDLASTTGSSVQLSSRTTGQQTGRRHQPERRRQVGFGSSEGDRGETA